MAALAVALACVPGTFVYIDTPRTPPENIDLSKLQGPSAIDATGWALEGVWEYKADSLLFGGFSAMLVLGEDTLRAFSDRGTRLTLTEPDQPQPERTARHRHDPACNVVRQLVTPGRARDLWDIESATRDPETGAYWLGYEHAHALHRFTIASETDGLRDLAKEVDWYSNAGAEAMIRLSDGRFVILPEGGSEVLIYPGDPVAGGDPVSVPFQTPAHGFAVTDIAQLPDDRLLLLLRDLDWGAGGWPPFASKLAIAELPVAGQEDMWAPSVTLDLTGVVPRENYEGLGVRPRGDGTVTVWLMSDDNFSAFQRTLLAKLTFDPHAARPRAADQDTADAPPPQSARAPDPASGG